MGNYKRHWIQWRVGIRKRYKGILSTDGEFQILKNPKDGWIADPFVYEYNSRTYVFVEKWDYKLQKGVIAYCEYLDNPEDVVWKDVIREDLHMSYPFIWSDNNGIHLMAETSESGLLYYYTSSSFPEVWHKDRYIDKGCYADTTLLTNYNERNYLFTYMVGKKGRLYKAVWDEKSTERLDWRFVSSDSMLSRPGGNFIREEDKTYRIAQDCSNRYGEAVFIIEVINLSPNCYEEKVIKKVSYKDLKVQGNTKNVIGIHTYNRSEKYEVVDFRFFEFNALDYIGALMNDIGKIWI